MEGDDEAMDPASALVGKLAATAASNSEGAKTTARLMERVLGPAADEIGAALQRYTAFRVGNVKRIVEKADRKAGGQGSVPPRVAHRILEEGSYCDDELMAEYFSGLLAGGRTPGGRDDRAVVWSDVVAGLSALQVRAHFLLYREWAARLHERSDLNLGLSEIANRVRLQICLDEFVRALLGEQTEIDPNAALGHTIVGLSRLGLIRGEYAMGNPGRVGEKSHFTNVLAVSPSSSGLELYGWAQGESQISPGSFTSVAKSFAEDEVPRLRHVEMPNLPPVPNMGDEEM